MKQSRRPQHVIVVGAGAAGLKCAHTLIDNGVRVTLVEARNRTMGRIFTRELPSGVRVEYGANWLYLNESSLSTDDVTVVKTSSDDDPQSFDTIIMEDLDVEVPRSVLDECFEMHAVLRDKLDVEVDKNRRKMTNTTLADAFQHVVELYPGFWLSTERRMHILEWLMHRATLDQACSTVDDVNAAWWRDTPDDGVSGEVLVLGGYDRLLERNFPHEKVANSLKLNQRVTRVEHGSTVYTEDGSVFSGDAVVMTVPIGVLKNSMSFEPPLPRAYRGAIERLRTGLLNLVHCEFAERFWPTRENSNATFIGVLQKKALFRNFLTVPSWRPRMLMIQVAGKNAIKAELMSEQQLIDEVYTVLSSVFSAAIAPLSCTCTKWHNDKYAQGSYSYPNVGAGPEDRQTLRQPIVYDGSKYQLLFAGEHTHQLSSVTGAISSGQRAALHLIQTTTSVSRFTLVCAAFVLWFLTSEWRFV